MKTILKILNLAEQQDDRPVLLDLIDDEVTRCRNAGDLLWGEWLLSKLPYVDGEQVERK